MKCIKSIAIALFFALTFGVTNASAADKQPMTPEFCEEGIQKAVEVFNEMVQKVDEITQVEQLQNMEQIMNSIKFRNVRKKYGKVELNDEYRARLLEANLKIAKSLDDMIVRLSLPYQVRKMLEEQASPEKIKQGIDEAKTLREVME